MSHPLQNMHSIEEKLSEIQATLKTLTDTLSAQPQENFKLLTIKEVSEIIGFNPDWIYKNIAANKFPKPEKIGRSSRWKSTTIQEWLIQNCH